MLCGKMKLQPVTKYCGTTPFSLKKYAYSLPSPIFNVERVWKLFVCGIALMAAWYIWQAQNLSTLKLGERGLCHNFYE